MLIRYYGHFGQQSGYGRAARELANALHHHGIKLDCRGVGPGAPAGTLATGTGAPDAVIVHTLPADCARVIDLAGLEALGCPLVAYTTWEATGFHHAWLRSREQGGWDGRRFDAVWMPWKDPMIGLEVQETRWIPHTYDPEVWERRQARTRDRDLPVRVGPRDVTRFYWMGQPTARKNPQGALRAFCTAFAGSDERVAMVFHAHMTPSAWASMLASTGVDMGWLREHVFGSSHQLAEVDIPDFHRQHDILVSASRGEAWNLPAFEAVLAGNPVIGVMGQGSDAFLCRTTSLRSTPLGLEPAWFDTEVVITPPRADGQIEASVVVTGLQDLKPHLHRWVVPDITGIANLMRRSLTWDFSMTDDLSIYSYASVASMVEEALHALRK